MAINQIDQAELQERTSSFEDYARLYSDTNKRTPARQGFDVGEYADALANPDTATVEVGIHGNRVTIPVVTAVKDWPWINEKFFERNFGAVDGIKFLGFPLIKDARIRQELKEQMVPHLQALARSGLPLVYIRMHQNPDRDPVTTELIEMLDEAHVELAELPKDIGEQTYFAGQLELNKAGGYSKDIDPRWAYVQALERGDLEASKAGPRMIMGISPEQIDYFYQRYLREFDVILESTPSLEVVDKETFARVIKSPGTQVFGYVTDNGEITTLSVSTPNLELLDWLNIGFLQRKFPDAYRNRSIYDFPFIFTLSEERNLGQAVSVIEHQTKFLSLTNNPILVTFDCCQATRNGIPSLVKAGVKRSGLGSIDFDKAGMGVEAYTMLRLRLRPDYTR